MEQFTIKDLILVYIEEKESVYYNIFLVNNSKFEYDVKYKTY
jgi:hypothetical protein